MNKTHQTKEQAIQKIKQYCSYQERWHVEVREKLYLFGLNVKDVEQIISQLIEENYMNEERFAIQYAGGKFRMKQWGRRKIKQALKQKQVSEYSIKKALKEINEEDYISTLNKLVDLKLKALRSKKNIVVKKKKLYDYLSQKGYERELVAGVLNR